MNSTFYKIETEEEQDALIDKTLVGAGTNIDELRRQGHEGQYESEKHRRSWFVVHELGRI